MTTIAVLGTGHMGAAIAQRLLATGHRVAAWNRTATRAKPLEALGADIATTPAAAVAGADLVITMLTDAAAVEAALFDTDTAEADHGSAAGEARPGSAVTAMSPGTVVVQMSTIGPDEVHGIAARLPRTLSLLDAPVGGSVSAVEAGTLNVFAAGEPTVLQRAEPVLLHLGPIHHCGPIGAGASLKLVINTALVTALAALHDTLAVADALGIDTPVAMGALSAGPLSGATTRATATGASFAISLAAKDMRLALGQARNAPVAAAALELLDAAADPTLDIAAMINRETR